MYFRVLKYTIHDTRNPRVSRIKIKSLTGIQSILNNLLKIRTENKQN